MELLYSLLYIISFKERKNLEHLETSKSRPRQDLRNVEKFSSWLDHYLGDQSSKNWRIFIYFIICLLKLFISTRIIFKYFLILAHRHLLLVISFEQSNRSASIQLHRRRDQWQFLKRNLNDLDLHESLFRLKVCYALYIPRVYQSETIIHGHHSHNTHLDVLFHSVGKIFCRI